jgi:hypothetical protein
VGLALAGASLAVERGGNLYWLVPTVLLAAGSGTTFEADHVLSR